MPAQPLPHVSHIDFSTIAFGPVEATGMSHKVQVYRDASSLQNKNKYRMNLCSDARSPITCPWGLDATQENDERRGMALWIKDEDTLRALQSLDELLIQKAVENSKEWFKKTLSEDQVRLRYKKIVDKRREEDEFHTMKVKVKCGGKVPTAMHLRAHDSEHHEVHTGTPEDIVSRGEVVPIVSASYGLWFTSTGWGLSLQVEDMIIIKAPESERAALGQYLSEKPLLVAAPPNETGGVQHVQIADTPPKDVAPSTYEPYEPDPKRVKTEVLCEDDNA